MTIDARALWDQVKANGAALNGCKRHRFMGGRIEKLGQKYTCAACGGQMGLVDIGNYIKGYEAAGGSADDIWPDYHGARA